MIGSISYSVDTSTIITVPTGIRASQYFGYNGGYNPSPTIEPGMAYWVKATSAGRFVLSSTPDDRVASRMGSEALIGDGIESFNSVTLTDRTGASQTLYIGMDRNGAFPLGMFEMPPPGPEGMFDARFESQRMVEVYRDGENRKREYGIVLHSASFPVTISWVIRKETQRSFVVRDGLSGEVLPPTEITGTGRMTIANPAVQRLIISTDLLGLPKEFTLLQNYPNPFNPSTTIRFGLPANARVTLRVYNILGQQVAEIVNAPLEAGYHELEWDGTGDRGVSVGSGVYFYRLEAVSHDGASKFHQVRKMVFMK
jgi:hypothetical protein